MTKKKKSHNAGYQSGKKQKPKQQQQQHSSDEDDYDHTHPMNVMDMMNQFYSNIPATVYSNGQKIEHADSRNAFSSFMSNLPSDSQQSMKELMARNLHCDEDQVEEIYGNKKKNNNNQKASASEKAKSNSTPTSVATSSSATQQSKKPPVNIFNMEPLGETLKELRFATSAEFDEHSRKFVEFHSKCAKALKEEYGMHTDRMVGIPIATFDSELLEIAIEQAALTRETQANSNKKEDKEHVMPLEPFLDKTSLPDWHVFKINGKGSVIAGQLAATLCKLFRLPLGSIRIIYTKYYNWKREYKEAGEFEPRGEYIIAVLFQYKERSAEDIIKSKLDWREKSKRVFKLELDTSKPLTEEENLNWLKYFHDRMITQKLHNDCCDDEVFDGSVEVIWNCLQHMMRQLYDPSISKEYLHNFVAQNVFLSIRPNYRDHKFLCGFKSYTRFYSLHSYGCVDFKYAFFHTTKYYSHVFYTTLLYRIVDLADKESREDQSSGWKPVWDNKLANDPRFQEEDWITIEKRQVNITLPEIKEIRETLIGKEGKLNCIPISKFLYTISNGTGAGSGETTLVDDDKWIEVRLRKICNELKPEDAEFKEHDFNKDIQKQLEEMKKKKPSKKNRNPMQSDASYPNDEESGNMYRMLKNGRGGGDGGFGGPPGCGQM
ncbi:predicted protein [Naegleria gruberi]|uniref:Predicted protein n=1 Tax=Naegleria gruberi TaxID=5762 RepID=D2VZE6_NAEGR|nr:uncharacterized protein NAEGRDRAFT_59671 [Naegleria gruberi]EFC37779.1 predicted protein [Naegleria gruberi]|eukprot:XP_002670523.1 predicted protein [Naegleria gruberi strain NEG-M]